MGKRLNDRISCHKNASNKCISRKIIHNPNVVIYELETGDYPTKEILRKREGYYIKTKAGNLEGYDIINRYQAGRTVKEYVEDNKDLIKEKNKQWRDSNKNYLNTQMKCSLCGGKTTRINKSHHLKTKKHIAAQVQNHFNSSSPTDPFVI